MTPDPARIAALVANLEARHRHLQSWRKVAALYPPIIKAGTLNRIAKSGGEYLPDDRRILRALGLLEQRKRTETEKRIAEMVRETRKAVMVKK